MMRSSLVAFVGPFIDRLKNAMSARQLRYRSGREGRLQENRLARETLPMEPHKRLGCVPLLAAGVVVFLIDEEIKAEKAFRQ
jgi:hypothetical protein